MGIVMSRVTRPAGGPLGPGQPQVPPVAPAPRGPHAVVVTPLCSSSSALPVRPPSPEPHPPFPPHAARDSLLANAFSWRWLGVFASGAGMTLGWALVRLPNTARFSQTMPTAVLRVAGRLPLRPQGLWLGCLLWGLGSLPRLAKSQDAGEMLPHRLLPPWMLEAAARGGQATALATYLSRGASGALWRLAPAGPLVAFVLAGLCGMETARTDTLFGRRFALAAAFHGAACLAGAALLTAAALAPLLALPGLVPTAIAITLLYLQFDLARREREATEFDAVAAARARPARAEGSAAAAGVAPTATGREASSSRQPAASSESEYDAYVNKRRDALSAGMRIVESAVGLAWLLGLGVDLRVGYELGLLVGRLSIAAIGAMGLSAGLLNARRLEAA